MELLGCIGFIAIGFAAGYRTAQVRFKKLLEHTINQRENGKSS